MKFKILYTFRPLPANYRHATDLRPIPTTLGPQRYKLYIDGDLMAIVAVGNE